MVRVSILIISLSLLTYYSLEKSKRAASGGRSTAVIVAGSGSDVVIVVEGRDAVVQRLDHHALSFPVLLLYCSKDYLVCFRALLVEGLGWGCAVLVVVLVFLCLLLWFWEISVPPGVEGAALSELLHFLGVLGHEGVGFFRSGGSFEGGGLVFVGYDVALLHGP